VTSTPTAGGSDSGPAAPGAGTTSTTRAPVPYPGAAWPTSSAAANGLASGPLEAIPAGLAGSDTDCVVVVKNGAIVYESTAPGFDADKDQIVWSVSKSITSLLVGIAAEDGKLRIEQPASDFVTEWKGTPSEAVTIRQLLSMTSGRHWDYETDFVKLPGAPDQTAFTLALDQQYPPGTRWDYNNGGVQVLEAVLSRATGTPVVDYAQQRLFGPLGITATWLTDKAGHPWTYGGATMSCREMARLGWLVLHGGRWEDRQVVPEAWVRESTKPSQDLRRNYGYLWWLNVPASGVTGETQSGDSIAGVPEDAFFARGLFGQFIAVLPEDGTVMIRTGRNPVDKERFPGVQEILEYLLKQVGEAERGA
jgi:CubicO group peptidase (beta-lactamase class C family)